MHTTAVLLFVVGAGLGAPCRYVVDVLIQSRVEGRTDSPMPYGTLAVNALGSTILGVVTALSRHDLLASSPRLALGTAFCGSLTTFSTFAFETVQLIELGAVRAALSNVVLNTVVTTALAATAFACTLAVT
jgi:fluoride exporter